MKCIDFSDILPNFVNFKYLSLLIFLFWKEKLLFQYFTVSKTKEKKSTLSHKCNLSIGSRVKK